MKLDRMLAITLELMAKKRVRASDLAARFEVSTRTIYREIELINQAGIPVVSFTGADGGFELMDGFFLTKQHFTVSDFSAIYQLLRGVEGAVGDRFTLLKDKLETLHPKLSNHDSEDLLLDLGSSTREEKEIVRVVYRAIQQKQVIAFTYRSASGTVTDRESGAESAVMGTRRLVSGRILLVPPCDSLVLRFTDDFPSLVGEKFQPRELVPTHPEDDPIGIHAHLRFDKTAEPRVSEQFAGQCRYAGEHIEVETVFYTKDYALSVVLSYGAKVVVVSPPELKEAVIEAIEEIRRRYPELGKKNR